MKRRQRYRIMADVRDILELEPSAVDAVTKDSILGSEKVKKKPKPLKEVARRPEGMHRELYALLYTDNKDAPPLFPTDTGQGYKQMKAKLGMRKVRPWKWMPFTNPARKDGAIFHHWRRAADEGKEYPFAQFNKQVPVPTYTDTEYQSHLHVEGWGKQETDHLFDLCRRFDLRFVVIRDRWDRSRFPDRAVEDLKQRYYEVCGILTKVRTEQVRSTSHQEPKVYSFDADHERRRKDQLKRLFERTPEQLEEEQNLLNEMRKIEARKKEREKKTQDLQKLITAADSQVEMRRSEKKIPKKKVQTPQARPRADITQQLVESAGIKFPDFKSSGVSVRSQRMKLPANVGQKKTKAIEQLLQELGIEHNPMPTPEICVHFNELRSDMVLLYELKAALATCEFELQTLRHQYEALNPGKGDMAVQSITQQTLEVPPSLVSAASQLSLQSTQATASPSKPPHSEIIDVVGSPGTPVHPPAT
ncbi:hypothetical protein B566_EDAN002305 [Ephemera danica]|nr:hypothetical protein B566_EDAN002305 [Ephemera danica]